MYRIVAKRELAPKINLYEVEAPQIAAKAQPGQFVILRISDEGERFPLTIVSDDAARGTVKFAFHEVGKSTKELATLGEGDSILDLVGPLGNPSEIGKFGRVLCVGGGVMTAPLHYVASALKDAGNELVVVVGARKKDLLIYEDEMKALSDEFYVATDDGSEGHTGLDFLPEILKNKKIDRIVAMGPVVMMQTISEMSKPHDIKAMVTLTPIMLDGTGMCGCCRTSVCQETKFVCVDGPEFDGRDVDWSLLISRQRIYLPEERVASLAYEGLGGKALF